MALERVLEPEVMDTYEEARDYDSMAHQGVNTLLSTYSHRVKLELMY